MAVRVPVCSWYMSVDFELFLLLPLYAVAFAYNRILGYAIPALLWAASIIYSWQVGGHLEYLMSWSIYQSPEKSCSRRLL